MDWKQLIRAMRQQGWTVIAEDDGWVDIETASGGQGGFERSPQGLREALRFYRQYTARSLRVPLPKRSWRTSSRSRRASHRSSYLVIVCAAFVILVAMYHGVMVPRDAMTCGMIMLLALVFIECARRISHLW